MGKIIFYEERNFRGPHYECTGDCTDLQAMLERCRSIRLESGMFMLYDRPGYMGNQCFLNRGDNPHETGIICMNDSVRSCRLIPKHHGTFRIKLYENFDMTGQMMELTDDCPNLPERFRVSNFNSCNVADGHWLMYEQPNYRGRHYYLRPGSYRNFTEWNGSTSRMGSVKRLLDL